MTDSRITKNTRTQAAQIHVIAPRSEITPLALKILREIWQKPTTIPQLYWNVLRAEPLEFADFLVALAFLFREGQVEGAVMPRTTESGRKTFMGAVLIGRPEVEGMMRVAEVPEVRPEHSSPVKCSMLNGCCGDAATDGSRNRLDKAVIRALAAGKYCDCGMQASFLCDCEKPICSRHSYDTFGEQCDFGICGECQEETAKHFNDPGVK